MPEIIIGKPLPTNEDAIVLDCKESPGGLVVLCVIQHSYHPFVIWGLSKQAECFDGDYYSTLDAACARFQKRRVR